MWPVVSPFSSSAICRGTEKGGCWKDGRREGGSVEKQGSEAARLEGGGKVNRREGGRERERECANDYMCETQVLSSIYMQVCTVFPRIDASLK